MRLRYSAVKLTRGWHAAIAVLVFGAIALQVLIAVRVSGTPPEVTTGLLRGASLAGRIIRVFSFFTIQSNLLCGVVSAQLAARPDRDGSAWRPLRLAALCGITVTGIVYSTVLAAIHQPNGPAETAVNLVVHYLVPISMVVGWLAFGPRPRIERRTVLAVPALPGAVAGLHFNTRGSLGVVSLPLRRRRRARVPPHRGE